MYDFTVAAASKSELYRDLASALDALTADEPDAVANMANVSALLWQYLPDLNWAGFYRNVGGELVITARKFRTQDANRTDARERVAELIDQALERQARRVKTKPSRAAKARRVDAKKGRSEVKAGRGKVRLD